MSRSITSNTLINLAGQAIPIAFALLAIPTIIHGIGTDRFGILAIAWLVIGYFSLFDLGLGRALTQIVSDRKNTESPERLAVTVWTALAIMLAMGTLGAIIIGLAAPTLAHSVFKVPPQLQLEAVDTFLILAAAIPLVVISAGLVGVLTAFDRFDLINLVRTPLGISNFAAPLVVMPFSHSLVDFTLVLVACRFLATFAQLIMCFRIMPSLSRARLIEASSIGSLLQFGGWMTVTNIVGPLMIYFDRFLIGATVSITAVTYYATPYEMATRVLIIPGAISATLFPRFSALHKLNAQATLDLLIRGWESVLVVLFPITLIAVLFAREGLDLWLGAEFALHSAVVLQWLAIGILFNALAHIPFALIQGAGRPDLSAKAHLLELAIYLPLLWWALKVNGIEGAATVWALRTLLDCALLSRISTTLVPGFKEYLYSTLPRLLLTSSILICITLLQDRKLQLLCAGALLLCSALLLMKLHITPRLLAIVRGSGLRVRSKP